MPVAILASLLSEITSALASLSTSPRLDAELLIERITGYSRARMRSHPELNLTQVQIERLQALLERRLRGEPMAYILGEREFWSLNLSVDAAVLIPRPETELVVERALSYLFPDQPAQVLDLGTGSGAIALALAQERPLATVTATDLSAMALEVARRNAVRLQLTRIHFVLSDWYTDLLSASFDLIVSNPPYIAADDPDLQPAVLASEPRMALIAGPIGLEAIRTIIAGAPQFLRAGGRLVLEHGWRQAEAVRGLLVTAGFSGVASHADLAGQERVTEGQWH